jgi:hypothetical protein
MDPNYRNPVTQEFNIGYSWAINSNTVFETEYTHVLGLHGNKTINIAQQIPNNGVCCTNPIKQPLIDSGQPWMGSVRNEEAIGREHYDGINFSFREQMKRFQLTANYTLAWAYGYGTGGGSFRNYPKVPLAPFAPWEWGPSPNDERSHITVAGVVNLPKGFEIAPILQYGTARPFDITNSSNTLNIGGGSAVGVVVPTSDPTDYFAFTTKNGYATSALANKAAQNCFYGLTGPASCTVAKYDPLRGDAFFQLDTRLAKNFKIKERSNLQLIAQAFNLTNRANYGNNYNNSIGNAKTFNHPAGFIAPSSVIIPRAIWGEFGARFTF